MTARIFRSALLCALAAAVLSAGLAAVAFLGVYDEDIAKELRTETEHLLYALSREQDEAAFFDGFSSQSRVTLIRADGSVVYDTWHDPQQMDNHADRPEVAQALESGWGESQRQSDTLDKTAFYCAARTRQGNVLRVAGLRTSVWGVVVEVMPLLIITLMLVSTLAVSMARSTAQRIVSPINDLDLDRPLSNEAYEELTPLLRRMEMQKGELEWQVQQMDEQNAEAETQRRELTANVSHELKTPLTSISGYAEIIRDGVVRPEDVPRFASRIHQEAARLLALVNDLLALSRLDEERGLGDKLEIDLYQTAYDAVSALLALAQDKQVALSLDGVHTSVSAYAGLLYEMVYNLVDNAIKYTPEGGSVRVQVGERTISVSDTGIGIPPEHQQRVFERFYRVDKSHSRQTGGTGLGLSIVKHGAKLHGAQIALVSEVGKGTHVTLTFLGK